MFLLRARKLCRLQPTRRRATASSWERPTWTWSAARAEMPIPRCTAACDATLDLTRNAATLRQLRLAARSSGSASHVLVRSAGTLADFSRPSWQAKISGELDMRLLEPLTGYPFAPEGIAHLNLGANGNAQAFQLDGRVHVDGGAYIGTGVVARGITLDAHVQPIPTSCVLPTSWRASGRAGRWRGSSI